MILKRALRLSVVSIFLLNTTYVHANELSYQNSIDQMATLAKNSDSSNKTHEEIAKELQVLDICSGGSADQIIEAAKSCTAEELSRNLINIQSLNNETLKLESQLKQLRTSEFKLTTLKVSTVTLFLISGSASVFLLSYGNSIRFSKVVGPVLAIDAIAALLGLWAMTNIPKFEKEVQIKEIEVEPLLNRLSAIQRELKTRNAIVTTIQTLKSQRK